MTPDAMPEWMVSATPSTASARMMELGFARDKAGWDFLREEDGRGRGSCCMYRRLDQAGEKFCLSLLNN